MRAAPIPADDPGALAQRLAFWLPDQRWFGGKGRTIREVRVADHARLADRPTSVLLALIEVVYQQGDSERYFLPLSLGSGDEAGIPGAGPVIADALTAPGGGLALLAAIGRAAETPTAGGGAVRFTRRAAFDGLRPSGEPSVRTLGVEQSNSSLVFGESLIMKCFRRIYDGPNPDLEIPNFLATRTDFRSMPRLAGSIEYLRPGGAPASLGILQEFVRSQGDGWSYTMRTLEAGAGEGDAYLTDVAELGRVTAALHRALASGVEPDFAPAPIGEEDIQLWCRGIGDWVERSLTALRGSSASGHALARRVLDGASRLAARAASLEVLSRAEACKTRYHGDYHLGQVLKTEGGWVVLDFEGEPLRSLAERRAKHCPLKDVAGMLRSFSYAHYAAPRAGSGDDAALRRWESAARQSFLDAYLGTAGGDACFLPRDPAATLHVLAAFELEKAAYELHYELNNRPDWVDIPLAALAQLSA